MKALDLLTLVVCVALVHGLITRGSLAFGLNPRTVASNPELNFMPILALYLPQLVSFATKHVTKKNVLLVRLSV